MKKAGLFLLANLITLITWAQDKQEAVEMADAMRADGKIYVVVAGLCLIFLGIVIYLVKIDRKISRIEKETKK